MMTNPEVDALQERCIRLERDRATRTGALLEVEQEVVELRAQVQERNMVIQMRDQELAALRAQLRERDERVAELTETKEGES